VLLAHLLSGDAIDVTKKRITSVAFQGEALVSGGVKSAIEIHNRRK
jgi:hypothetical protein